MWKTPDNSSVSHFSAMKRRRPGSVGENRHRHAIEQASHRRHVEDDATIQTRRKILISTQAGTPAAGTESSRPSVAPAGAGFKVLYPQLPEKRGFGVDSQSALKGFLKYAAASRVTLVHLVRLSQLERFMSLESIRRGQIRTTMGTCRRRIRGRDPHRSTLTRRKHMPGQPKQASKRAPPALPRQILRKSSAGPVLP